MFEIVAEHPELQPFATDFWMRGGSHVLAVLAAGESRLPASRRADFFHKSAAVLGPTAPPMFELPMTDLGLKYRLVAMNNYPAFQALKVVNGQRIRARKLKKKFGPKLRAAANAAKRTRLNESSAVFTSLWNRPHLATPWPSTGRCRSTHPTSRARGSSANGLQTTSAPCLTSLQGAAKPGRSATPPSSL